MKERYSFKEDIICHVGKWTTREKSIQYLRKLAMLEVNELAGQLQKYEENLSSSSQLWKNGSSNTEILLPTCMDQYLNY